MYEVNRSIVLVIPREPFWLWLKTLQEPGFSEYTLEDLQVDANAYLIEPCEDIDEAWDQIEEQLEKVFSAELADWSEDRSTWPDLHPDIFAEWFDLQLSSIVTDLSGNKLDREAFVPFVLD
ncbi:VacJ [Neisseria sp. Ec49-e6-T10]|uniref:VacJ n=1 Tax=Neisseria sp. Ec49-e6-T10 TaxID=3140744 RepID=UPI003EB9671F